MSRKRKPVDYTYEEIEILDMMTLKGRQTFMELRNKHYSGKIEIMDIETIISPRTVTVEGDVYETKVEKVVEYATISKQLLESDADTEV